MTRINSAIPVRNLTDEHLLAEHREIKRLPYCLDAAIRSGSVDKIPSKFTLGKGHVLFFLDKQGFILWRYKRIYEECVNRGFKVDNYSENWRYVMSDYMESYEPTIEEHQLLVERITGRILHGVKEFYHYRGNRITKEEAIELLKEKS